MTTDELTVLARGLAVDTKAFVAETMRPLRETIAALELEVKALRETVPAVGPKGDTGDRGATGEPGRDGSAGMPGPPGPMGPMGLPGKDVDWSKVTAAIELLVVAAVTKELAARPVPRDGVDGKDGRDGADGAAGAAGRDGRDGQPGLPGPPGEKGADGLHGANGQDGTDGRDGVDGKDGMGFDDVELTFDETKGWIWSATNGDRTKTWPVPMFWYDRTWTAKAYKAGTVVTKTGSLWAAMVDTRAIPGESKDWVLIVRRGQDGKDAKGSE